MKRKIFLFIAAALVFWSATTTWAQKWSEPVNVSNTPAYSSLPKLLVDNSGSLHLFWEEMEIRHEGHSNWPIPDIFYACNINGVWSNPISLHGQSEELHCWDVIIDKNDTLHLVYAEERLKGIQTIQEIIFYTQKAKGGRWSEPEVVGGSKHNAGDFATVIDEKGISHIIRYNAPLAIWNLTIAIDSQGTPHIVINGAYGVGKHKIFYLTKDNGIWIRPEEICFVSTYSTWKFNLAVDSQDKLHLTYKEIGNDGKYEVMYRTKPENGVWSQPEEIIKIESADGSYSEMGMGIDSKDNLHFVWSDITFKKRLSDLPFEIAPHGIESDFRNYEIPESEDFSIDFTEIFYAVKSKDGSFSSPINISDNKKGRNYRPHLTINDDKPHVIWPCKYFYRHCKDWMGSLEGVMYTIKVGNDWLAPNYVFKLELGMPSNFWGSSLAVENGNVHCVWDDKAYVWAGEGVTSFPQTEYWRNIVNDTWCETEDNQIDIFYAYKPSHVTIATSADRNGSGTVDVTDLMVVLREFGDTITAGHSNPNPDVNGDGIVDILDVVLVAKYIGESYEIAAPPRNGSQLTPDEVALLREARQMLEALPQQDEDIQRAVSLINQLITLAEAKTPATMALLQNYPNPFNPDTWIPYQLAENVDVAVRIYNVSGQLIRTLNLGHKPAGFYTTKERAAYWDGRNEAGEPVASGIYFCTIQAGDFTATKKMTIAR